MWERGSAPVDPSLVRDLGRAVGPGGVLSSRVSCSAYEYDATLLEGSCQAVVFPADTQEVSRVLEICARRGVPVTPRGHGTGLSGGAIPESGVVLSLTRMNEILEIDGPGRRARVQPGVVNSCLQERLSPLGLRYAPDPASQKVCSLGGNVAEGAGGMRGFKYGVTRDHVVGLTGVLADGQIVEVGGSPPCPAGGPDWTGLLVGSEGTLMVVTEIEVALEPVPPAANTMLAAFSSLERAGAAVSAIVSAGIIPAALEIMDRAVMEAVEAYLGDRLAPPADAVLLLELDGLAEDIDVQAERVTAICQRQGAQIQLAADDRERDRLWSARRSALGAVARLRPCYDLEDVTVPRGQLVPMLRAVDEVRRQLELDVAMVAHAGDGNLHPMILFDDRDEEEMERMLKARDRLFRLALDLGGTLSGEHGIGLTKREFMPLVFPPAAMTVLESVKAAFDPAGTLNPGKILDTGGV